MEKLLKYYLIISLLAFGLISCSDSDNEKTEDTEKEYILKAEVTNKPGASVVVDNPNKIITVKDVKKKDGWHDINIKLTLGQYVYMVKPTTEEATYNLAEDAEIEVRYGAAGGKSIKYKVTIEDAENEIDPESKGWKKTTEFGSLPEGITIYLSPDELQGKKVKACIAVADMIKGRKYAIRGGDANGLKTPDKFYGEQQSSVIINGSYFYSTWNVGLLVKNGTVVRAANSQEVTREGPDGTNVTYYPTRGIFSFTKDGKYQVDWVYTVDDVIYGYPQPSPIVAGEAPQPKPSATFPAGAKELKLQDAIGAGPVLVKNSKVQNTYGEEIWDDAGGILPNGSHPRTAVGVTETLKVIYFVCEGRQATPGVAGLSTKEVAEIMLDLGCTDALNLDGGGSTCMLVNGRQTIKTSNTDGAQRAVATILTLN